MANQNPGADVITFDPAVFTQPMTISGLSVGIVDDLTIDGPAARLTLSVARVSASNLNPSCVVTLSNLDFLNASLNAGTTYSFPGTLKLSRCRVTQSPISHSRTALDISDCDFTGDGRIGGTKAIAGSLSTVKVRRSTFSNCQTGINNQSNLATEVENCTFAGDQIAVDGQDAQIRNCTFASNNVAVYTHYGAAAVSNCIFAGNTTDVLEEYPVVESNDFHGTLAAAGLDSSGGTARLAANGGFARTVRLLAGSPAIDAAGDTGLDTDQRGVTRPQGIADDLGALEVERNAPAVSITQPADSQSMLPGSWRSAAISGTAADDFYVGAVAVRLYRTRSGVKEYWNGSAFAPGSVDLPCELALASAGAVTWRLPVVPGPAQMIPGAYQLEAFATDGDGNLSPVAKSSFSVISENVPPTATIEVPRANAVISPEDLLYRGIAGRATDNDGIASGTVKLYRNDSVRQYWNGTSFVPTVTALAVDVSPGYTSTGWALSPLPSKSQLVPGSYGINFFVRDISGNTASVTRSFTIVADSAAPVVTIGKPSVNQHVPVYTFTFEGEAISGTATDDMGIASVSIKFFRTVNGVKSFWNGIPFYPASYATDAYLTGNDFRNQHWKLYSWPSEAALIPGNYSIYITARDAAGKVSPLLTRNFVIDGPIGTVKDVSPSGRSF